MAYKPKVLTVSEGGYGLSSYTTYTPICGGTTSTGSFQSLSSIGNSGQVLTSNGAGALPSFQDASGGGLGYFLNVDCSSGNPSDGVTYVFCKGLILTTTYQAAAPGNQRLYVPKEGTITKYIGNFTVAGTLGSSQSVTLSLYVNNSSVATIATFTLDSASVSISNTGLSASVSAGDYVSIVMSCPTWSPNPTTVSHGGTIYIT